MTIKQFVKDNKIVIDVTKIAKNPYAHDDEWGKQASHYQVIFRFGEKKQARNSAGRMESWMEYIGKDEFVTYYSMGSAHEGKKPTVEDVLDCLASDAQSVQYEDMDSWIENMGYTTEGMKAIRSAEETYRIIKKQSSELEKFLGRERYNQLLEKVERL